MDMRKRFATTESKYIKAQDLEDDGTPMSLTISSIEEVEFDGDEHPKAVVYFQGRKKGLVLNITNTRTICDLHGDVDAEWIGKKVYLFQSACTNQQGKTVACVRVKPVVPKDKPAAEVDEEPIPF